MFLFHPLVDCSLSSVDLSKNSSVLCLRSLLREGERMNVYRLQKPAPTQTNHERFLLRAGDCKKQTNKQTTGAFPTGQRLFHTISLYISTGSVCYYFLFKITKFNCTDKVTGLKSHDPFCGRSKISDLLEFTSNRIFKNKIHVKRQKNIQMADFHVQISFLRIICPESLKVTYQLIKISFMKS